MPETASVPASLAPINPSVEYLAGGERRWASSVPLPRVLSSAADDASRRFGPELWDLMDNDPVVHASAAKLPTQALSKGLHLCPAVDPEPGEEPTGDAAKAQEIAEWQAGMLRDLAVTRPVEDVAHEMMTGAIAFGNKLAEVVEFDSLVDGRRCWRKLACKPWWAWRLAVNPQGEPLGVVPAVPTPTMPAIPAFGDLGIIAGDLIPMEHVLLLAWDARNGDPRGRSLYRHVYVPWNCKAQSIPDYFSWLRRFAGPAVDIELPPIAWTQMVDPLDEAGKPIPGQGKIPLYLQVYQSALRYRMGGVLLLPAGARANLKEPSGQGDSFLKGYGYFDRQIAHGILHAARATMEAEHGSKADAKAGAETSDDLAEWVAGWFCRALRGALRENVRANWGDEAARKFTPKVAVGDPGGDRAAFQQFLISAGYRLSPSQLPALDARLGLPRRPEGAPTRSIEDQDQ